MLFFFRIRYFRGLNPPIGKNEGYTGRRFPVLAVDCWRIRTLNRLLICGTG